MYGVRKALRWIVSHEVCLTFELINNAIEKNTQVKLCT